MTNKETCHVIRFYVNRGGSWFYVPQYARVAYRSNNTPDDRIYFLGVRLVEEVEETK